jgi:hypothetical protein
MSYVYASLSLIGLCALAGAGVGIGSGVAMMASAMAEEESKQKASEGSFAAASPQERKPAAQGARGFAASAK